jgi:hypothetical protein
MRRVACTMGMVPALLAAQGPVAHLDTAVARIGERMVLTLEWSDAPSGVVWPVVGDTLTRQIEVVQAGAVDTVMITGSPTLRQRIAITAFDTGHWAIPPFQFRVGDQAMETRPLLVEVRAMPLDAPARPRAVHGIIDPPMGPGHLLRRYGPWGLALAAGVALVLGLLRWLRRRRPVAEAAPVAVAEPPHVRVLAALRAVEGEHLWQSGRHKEYHARVTDLLRAYIEERYAVPALERTTRELMQELSTSAMPLEQQRSLQHMLELADMVKFARFVPAPTENESLMRHAVRLVEATVPAHSIAPEHAL